VLTNVLCTYVYDLNGTIVALEWLPFLIVLDILFVVYSTVSCAMLSCS
jgi:hypothetical protein